MQELIHPADSRELAERETRHDYHEVCNQALPSIVDLERELRDMRAEIRAVREHERMSPLTDTWLRHQTELLRKDRL